MGDDVPTWTNWGLNLKAQPSDIARPATDEDAITTVRAALADGLEIRPLGAGHSFSALVPTPGIMIDARSLAGITGVDSDRRRVRVRGGTLISDIGDDLWDQGFALLNQGDIDRQTIAGAVSTGTHGSGVGFTPLSGCVTWIRLIDGSGEIHEIDSSDGDCLQAARLALGSLGLILELELQVADAYFLQELIDYPSWDEVRAEIDEQPARWRHYSWLWMPRAESAALYELETPPGSRVGETVYRKRYVEAAIGSGDSDRSYRVYPASFDLRFHELEYFVAGTDAGPAADAVRAVLARHPDQAYPLEVRWMAGDDSLLSPTAGRETVSLSVAGAPGADYLPYLRDVHAALAAFDARPHWGKIHFFEADDIDRLFPAAGTFREIRRDFDPDGKFLNDHTRSLIRP